MQMIVRQFSFSLPSAIKAEETHQRIKSFKRAKALATAARRKMLVEPLHLNLDVIDPATSSQMVNKVVTLVNVEGQRVAFKIQTTARNLFTTTPNSGILQPGDEIDIIVTMVGFSPEQYAEVASSMSCSDKFLVRSAPVRGHGVTEEHIRGEGGAAWWNERPKSEISDQIITCSYVRQADKVEMGQAKLRFLKCADANKTVGSCKVLAEETLVLLNNSPSRHAFKVRTTARDRYRVEPSCGLINSGARFTIRCKP